MSHQVTRTHGQAFCRLSVNTDRGVAYLYNLMSQEPGNGDGGRLVAECIAEAEEAGCELRLHTSEAKLATWYAGYGFQVEGDFHKFWGWTMVRRAPARTCQ